MTMTSRQRSRAESRRLRDMPDADELRTVPLQALVHGTCEDGRDSLIWPREGGLKWPRLRGWRGVVVTV